MVESWHAGESDSGTIYIWSNAVLVATVDGENWSPDELEMHAAMVAAAPELLGAVKAIVAMWDRPLSLPLAEQNRIKGFARAAIAKAEGKQ